MKLLLLLSLLTFDEKLAELEDVTQPSVEEYEQLQEALHNDLPAPLPIGNNPQKKYYRLKKRFQFTDSSYPTLIVAEGKTSECIVSYTSCNPPYSQWVEELPQKFREIGYEGAFRARVGGWPNLKEGDLSLASIPYAFKLSSFREAKNCGYSKILWVDSALLPKRNLDRIFEVIDCYGYMAVSTGATLLDLYHKGEFDLALINYLGIDEKELREIPHVQGGVIGIHAKHKHGIKILKKWHELTRKKEASISGYPEEVILSCVLYKLGLPPTLKNSSMWQEDTSLEKGRDPYFILQTTRPD